MGIFSRNVVIIQIEENIIWDKYEKIYVVCETMYLINPLQINWLTDKKDVSAPPVSTLWIWQSISLHRVDGFLLSIFRRHNG